MEIRRGEQRDLPGLIASSAGLFAEDAGTRDSTMNTEWPLRHGERSFRAALDDPGKLVLVADTGTRIAGHLSGTLDEPTPIRPIRVANLGSVFVHAEYRSEGVGGRLLDAFVRWAIENDAERLSVTAYASNVDAIRFYERHGFAPHSLTLERGLP